MSGLHGVDSQTVSGGVRNISTVPSAIIGLIGTAPDAEGATAATAFSGSTLLDNSLIFTAKGAGIGNKGNGYLVQMVAGEEGTTAVVATFALGVLKIVLPVTDSELTATAADVVTAVTTAALTDIEVALAPGILGEGIVDPVPKIALTGGADEPFPLGKPWIIAGSSIQADRLGDSGTLKTAVKEIFSQTGALIVGVRVAPGAGDAATLANVVAGMDIFLLAQTTNGQQPRVFIAPGFSEDDSVGKALEVIATRMAGVAYIDSASMASPEDVVRRRSKYGERVEILRPRVVTTDANGLAVVRPYSAFAAGLRARIDNELGYWWSKSNQEVLGFMGLEQVESWSISDENSTTNLLNMNNVSTIINYGGFKHWGNRNCSIDPLRWFESAIRTDDVLRASIKVGLFPYIDKPLDIMLANDAISAVNSYLREQTELGAIHGGTAWLDRELNTAETLSAGHLYVDYDYGFKSPAERITCRVHVNTEYAKEALSV